MNTPRRVDLLRAPPFKTLLKSVLALSVALFGSSPLWAASLETANYVRLGLNEAPGTFYVCEAYNGAVCRGQVLAPGTNWTLHYYSASSAGYGVLRGFASAYLTGDDSLGAYYTFASVGGRAGFRDSLLINGSSGPGTAWARFYVTGRSSQTSGQSGRPQMQWVPVVSGNLDWNLQRNYGVSQSGWATVAFPFTFGTPIEFAIYFYALAQIWDWTADASAMADYATTAVLAEIQIRDGDGNLVENFNILSESGTPYGPNGVVFPVTIQIKDGHGTPALNPKSRGVTPVAVLSTEAFDAPASVDPGTLTFGRTGLEHSLSSCHAAGEDVNGDGLADLLCFFHTPLTGFRSGDTEGLLKGFTFAGAPIAGSGALRIVPK